MIDSLSGDVSVLMDTEVPDTGGVATEWATGVPFYFYFSKLGAESFCN